MTELYLMPRTAIQLLGGVILAAILLQTLNLSSGFRSLERSSAASADTCKECFLLAEMILTIGLLADVLFYMETGFVRRSRFPMLRWVLFGASTAVFLADARKKRRGSSLYLLLPMTLTLPPAERLPGYGWLLWAAGLCCLARSGWIFAGSMRNRKKKLTVSSIKEVLDRLDSGLLYTQKNGQILLQNQLMQHLMVELTGKLQVNGREFLEALRSGQVRPVCQRLEAEGEILYHLENGSLWDFRLLRMDDDRRELLLASDVTEWWEASREIRVRNQELEQKNRELRKVLSNLEEICLHEAALEAKSRVHDVLGQNISLLLRAMREQREPDEVLLQTFAEGLPRELREVVSGSGCDFAVLVKVFANLGVTLRLMGEAPKDKKAARVFYEIAMEAVTNAVRHGYATEVDLKFTKQNGTREMEIRNRGMLPEEPVREGGGLSGMREKAASLGGTCTYAVGEDFCVHVSLPEGGFS